MAGGSWGIVARHEKRDSRGWRGGKGFDFYEGSLECILKCWRATEVRER